MQPAFRLTRFADHVSPIQARPFRLIDECPRIAPRPGVCMDARNHGLGSCEIVTSPSRMRCPALPLLLPLSIVRDAMVSIMLAGGSPQYRNHSGASSPFQPSPLHEQGLVGEDSDDTRQGVFGEMSAKVDEGCWSNALAADRGSQILPRDSSTCILWCAVALGALVRGRPVAQVGRYLPCCLSCPLHPFHAYL